MAKTVSKSSKNPKKTGSRRRPVRRHRQAAALVRQSGAGARAERRRSRLHGQAHRGAGGPGAGAAPPRHVYRRHRREGAASPVRRGDRQLDGRGAGRPRHLHRGRTRRRRLHHRHRQRPRHAGRSASEVQEQVGARSDHVHACTPAANSTPRSTRPRAACMASASRSPTPCPTTWRSRSRAARSSTGWCSSAASRRASCRTPARRRTAAAPRCASIPIRKSSARRRISSPSACSR